MPPDPRAGCIGWIGKAVPQWIGSRSRCRRRSEKEDQADRRCAGSDHSPCSLISIVIGRVFTNEVTKDGPAAGGGNAAGPQGSSDLPWKDTAEPCRHLRAHLHAAAAELPNAVVGGNMAVSKAGAASNIRKHRKLI